MCHSKEISKINRKDMFRLKSRESKLVCRCTRFTALTAETALRTIRMKFYVFRPTQQILNNLDVDELYEILRRKLGWRFTAGVYVLT